MCPTVRSKPLLALQGSRCPKLGPHKSSRGQWAPRCNVASSHLLSRRSRQTGAILSGVRHTRMYRTRRAILSRRPSPYVRRRRGKANCFCTDKPEGAINRFAITQLSSLSIVCFRCSILMFIFAVIPITITRVTIGSALCFLACDTLLLRLNVNKVFCILKRYLVFRTRVARPRRFVDHFPRPNRNYERHIKQTLKFSRPHSQPRLLDPIEDNEVPACRHDIVHNCVHTLG